MTGQGGPPEVAPKIRMIIVDDHSLMRGGLRKLLELEPEFIVIGEAGTGEEALALTRQLAPDVVLLDINLPTLNGLEVTARLRAEGNRAAVIVLTAYDQTEQVFHAMRAGAAAYCPKGIDPERLFDVIRKVATGAYVIDGRVYTARGVKEWLDRQREALSGAGTPEDGERHVPLSPREMEILRHLTRGLHNKAIAQALGISHQTVRNHITSILTKLNVRGRTGAAVIALKRGWVSADEFNPPPENADNED